MAILRTISITLLITSFVNSTSVWGYHSCAELTEMVEGIKWTPIAICDQDKPVEFTISNTDLIGEKGDFSFDATHICVARGETFQGKSKMAVNGVSIVFQQEKGLKQWPYVIITDPLMAFMFPYDQPTSFEAMSFYDESEEDVVIWTKQNGALNELYRYDKVNKRLEISHWQRQTFLDDEAVFERLDLTVKKREMLSQILDGNREVMRLVWQCQ